MSPFDAQQTTGVLATGLVYFSGISATDGSGAIFTVAPPSTIVTRLSTGTNLVAPVAIAVGTSVTDGNVYIADPAALNGTNTSGPGGGFQVADDRGGIFSMPAAGGAATIVSGTEGYAPTGVVFVAADVVNGPDTDTLYFTGHDPSTGAAGVFTIAPSGGSVTTLSSGVFSNPSQLTYSLDLGLLVADNDGRTTTIYEVDTGSGDAEAVVGGLLAGVPSGIGISSDGDSVYIAVVDPTTGKNAISHQGPDVSEQLTATDANAYGEPAGLHVTGTTATFVDSSAGGSGAVFLISL